MGVWHIKHAKIILSDPNWTKWSSRDESITHTKQKCRNLIKSIESRNALHVGIKVQLWSCILGKNLGIIIALLPIIEYFGQF